ncbi:hypothetical protein [uncultured Sphingomonas sp.]|uniref:hypothetical protein n=1 Tax=uncultured Sphingomonas sp. TaxID=158754 RepID=UPI0025E8C50B|nr:hypothetical protein [uncultured Sphingomonas sp.]
MLLLAVGACYAAFLNGATPNGVRTPRAVTEAAVHAVDRKAAATGSPAAGTVVMLSRAASGDPLLMLIAAKGFACQRIDSVEPLAREQGIFAIHCRDHAGGLVSYAVDTRLQQVQPLAPDALPPRQQAPLDRRKGF